VVHLGWPPFTFAKPGESEIFFKKRKKAGCGVEQSQQEVKGPQYERLREGVGDDHPSEYFIFRLILIVLLDRAKIVDKLRALLRVNE